MAKPVIREDIIQGYIKSATTTFIPQDIIKLIQLMIHCLSAPNFVYYSSDLRANLFLMMELSRKKIKLEKIQWGKRCITYESIKWMKDVFFIKLKEESNETNNIPSFLQMVWSREATRTDHLWSNAWISRSQELFSRGAVSFLFHAMAGHIQYGMVYGYPIWQCLFLGGEREDRSEFVSDVLEVWIEHTQIDTNLEYKVCMHGDHMEFKNVLKIFNLLNPFFEFMAAIEEYFAQKFESPDIYVPIEYFHGIWFRAKSKTNNENKREFVKHLLNGVMRNKSVHEWYDVENMKELDDEYLDRCMKMIGDKEITLDFFVVKLRVVLMYINTKH